ncbi:MAG: acetolactate synthase small subunit [Desulfobacteraceae bacterium]
MSREKHILTMLVENEPGVTARITGLFAGRGYNIETICGAPTANPHMSRITITTWAEPLQLEQCMKQIRRLTNVIKLRDMTGRKAVKRELAIVCVAVLPENREKINAIAAGFNGKVIDQGGEHLTFEVTDKENRIDELLTLLKPFGVKKLARSGLLALYREQ